MKKTCDAGMERVCEVGEGRGFSWLDMTTVLELSKGREGWCWKQ